MRHPELLYAPFLIDAMCRQRREPVKDKRCYVCKTPHNNKTKFCSDDCNNKYLKKGK